jgi:hypothetical protein
LQAFAELEERSAALLARAGPGVTNGRAVGAAPARLQVAPPSAAAPRRGGSSTAGWPRGGGAPRRPRASEEEEEEEGDARPLTRAEIQARGGWVQRRKCARVC